MPGRSPERSGDCAGTHSKAVTGLGARPGLLCPQNQVLPVLLSPTGPQLFSDHHRARLWPPSLDITGIFSEGISNAEGCQLIQPKHPRISGSGWMGLGGDRAPGSRPGHLWACVKEEGDGETGSSGGARHSYLAEGGIEAGSGQGCAELVFPSRKPLGEV